MYKGPVGKLNYFWFFRLDKLLSSVRSAGQSYANMYFTSHSQYGLLTVEVRDTAEPITSYLDIIADPKALCPRNALYRHVNRKMHKCPW